MSFSTRSRGPKGRFRPRLEALEDRSVPAIIGPVVSPTDPGTIYFVANNPNFSTSNQLNIFDNGLGVITFNTGTSLTAKQSGLPKGAAANIHRIIYFASSGTDKLTYNVPKNSAIFENMEVDVVLPGTGETGFTAQLGVPAMPAVIPGSPGVTPVPGAPSQPLNVAGHFNFSIFGNVGRDNVTLTYDGRVNGLLETLFTDPQKPVLPHAHGRDGDKVSFNLVLEPFSTGVVRPHIRGGIGDDALTLFVRKLRSKDSVHILQQFAVDGGPGNNTATLGFGATGINV